MKSQDNLFEDGDPFDNPLWKTAKTTTRAADFVGCPMAWLDQVLPHIKGASQLVVVQLLYRRWVLGGRRRTFEFSNADLKRLGISRAVKAKALATLEQSGVISVEHRPGCAPVVTRHWK